MNREIVKQKMKELLDVDTKSLNMRLPIALGKTQDGMICFRDLTSLHHLLIAGAAGQGKTSCLNGMIASLSKSSHWPEIVSISAKGMYELCHSNTIPLAKTEHWDAMYTLEKLNKEVEIRLKLFKEEGVRTLEEYQEKYMDYITLRYMVVIIDDYDHLILSLSPNYKHKMFGLIVNLAQKGSQVGVHLIITTQKITYDIISGCLIANFPARIAFRVDKEYESRMILYQAGAEKLDGIGKLIFSYYDEFFQLQGILT